MKHGILSGPEIERRVASGDIQINPYDRKRVNPSSYDLTLGPQVKIYNRGSGEAGTIDTRKPSPDAWKEVIIGSEGLVLYPGVGYLMHSIEWIRTDKFVGCIDGKSTLGRLFISVHQTAGYVDCGFDGQYTLEVIAAVFPVRVYAGMPIAQVRFHTVHGVVRLYKGRYVGKSAMGAVQADTSGLSPTKDRT
jgi:dCTP deaminase